MAECEEKDVKRISIDLPIELIEGVDRLRKEWGLRRRGLVFERLLQVILSKDIDEEIIENEQLEFNKIKVKQGVFGANMQISLVNDGPVTIILDSNIKS